MYGWVYSTVTAGGRVERSFPISLSLSPLWHTQSSPHVRPHSFPRRPQLCARNHHVVHFPSFMHFIDYCLRAYSLSSCTPRAARALSWACPIPEFLREFRLCHSVPPEINITIKISFLFFMTLMGNEELRCRVSVAVLPAPYEINP